MDCRIHLEEHGAMALAQQWRELHSTCGQSPFTQFEWIMAWWRNFGRPNWSLHIATGWEHGRLVALIPLAVNIRNGLRIIEWAGADVLDYVDILSEGPEFTKRLWDYVRKHGQFDIAILRDVDPRGPSAAILNKFTTPVEKSHSSFLSLEWSRSEEWIGTFSRETRHRNKRKRTKLENGVELRFDFYFEDGPPSELLPSMVEQKTHWALANDQPGMFRTDRALPFLRELSEGTTNTRQALFASIYRGSELVAGQLSFISEGRCLFYLSTYNEKFSAASPGRLLLYETIGWAIDHGLREFDFLRGPAAYKTSLASGHRALHEFTFARTVQGHFGRLLATGLKHLRSEL